MIVTFIIFHLLVYSIPVLSLVKWRLVKQLPIRTKQETEQAIIYNGIREQKLKTAKITFMYATIFEIINFTLFYLST